MAKKKTILVIDDNPHIYVDFINVLKGEYEISVSSNLVSATKNLERFHYDLVIIDIMMSPEGMELEIADEYRAGLNYYYFHIREKYPDMMVIFWSAFSNNSINKYFANKGGIPENIHYIDKYVYTPDEFERFVKSILFPKTNNK